MSNKRMMKSSLGVRMKTFYKQIPKIKLMRRCPIIYRIDSREYIEQLIDIGDGLR